LNSFTFRCRLAALAAYGVSLILFHFAELHAEKVYDDLCSHEGITFGEPSPILTLVAILAVFSVPTLLARSRAMIFAGLTASLTTVAGAVLLLFTASDTPYECFTMGGTYEDHTSGLLEFTLWSVVIVLASFAFLVIDLPVSGLRKLTTSSE